MAELKRAYLFTGDDEVKIDQARKRLAARAQADGAQLEPISGDACTPQNFAAACVQDAVQGSDHRFVGHLSKRDGQADLSRLQVSNPQLGDGARHECVQAVRPLLQPRFRQLESIGEVPR